MTPSELEYVTLCLVDIIAIIFNVSASKLSLFNYVSCRSFFFIYESRMPSLYNHLFVFNSDIDVTLLFKL